MFFQLTYQRGKFLGKGGFAKCYEFLPSNGKRAFAGKIVPKNMLTKAQLEKNFFYFKNFV